MSLGNCHRIFSSIMMSYFFICAISLNAYGQINNIITGFIFGPEQRPVSDASVELLDDNYGLISRVKTDGSGRYIFSRLQRGRYYIQVSVLASNYDRQIKEVEISGINRSASNDTVQQNFYLKPKPSNDLLAVNGVVFAQEIPKDAQKLYENANSLLKEKKIDEGLAELKKALEIFPSYYLALDRLGQEYISQQKYQDAYDVLTKAVEINPKGFSSQYSLGYSLYQLKKYKEAIVPLKKSVEIVPGSTNGFFMLGVCLKQIGNYEAAVEHLKKADKLSNSGQADIHWQLSLIYTNNLKRYAEAAYELELFLKAKPDFVEAEKVRDLINKLKAKAKG